MLTEEPDSRLHLRQSRKGDRNRYERRILQHMLEVRTERRTPVVCGDVMLREFIEDISAITPYYRADPDDIRRWAIGRSEDAGSEPQRLCCEIHRAYLVMVGAFSFGYHPDWLRELPSPRWGDARFPAWTADGRRVL
jgi:hypothetical protein